MSYPRPIKHYLIVVIICVAVSRRASCALKVNLSSGNIASTSRITTTKKDVCYTPHKTTIITTASKADTVPRADDEESSINDGSSNNNATANYTPILPPLSTDANSIFQKPKAFTFTTRSKEQRQQQTKKTNSSLIPSRDAAEDDVFSSSSDNKKSKNSSILENFIFPSSSSKIQSKSSSKKCDDNNSNVTKKTPLSLFSASLSASLIYPLPDRNETLTSGTKTSSLYSSSILDGVLPVSELFYRSTQSLVDDSTSTTSSSCDEGDSITTSAIKKDKTTGNAIFSAAANNNNNNSNNRRPNQATNSRFGDDEELPFSAEQSDRLTSKGINKINVRRNEADTFTTLVASSGDSNNNIIEGGRNNKSEALSYSSTTNTTITTVTTTASTAATSGNKGGSGSTRKISSYNVRTSRYVNTKYNSTTTNSTRAGSPSPRRGNQSSSNKQRSNSSGKIIRRGMEMLVGGEPINADPPLKSIEIRYDASISDWTHVITTTSRDFGPLLHHSSAGLISETSKALFCEYFVNSAMKWNVCPQEFTDMVQEYENAILEYNATLAKKRSSSFRGGAAMFYQDLLGRLIMDEEQQLGKSKYTNNGLPSHAKDSYQQKLVEENRYLSSSSQNTTGHPQDATNKTSESSAAADLLHNFPIFNSRGFGKPSSPLLRGGGRKSRAHIRTKQTMEFCLCFDLNISRSDLLSGHDEGVDHGVAFKRILSRGISKAIRAEEMGYIVKINDLNLLQEASGNTNVSLHFNIIPDHLRRFKNVQRDMMKMDRIFSQGGETQIDLSIGIATAAKEEAAWTPELKHRFIEEMFPPLNNDLGEENSATYGDILERSGSLRNGYMLKFELGVNKDDLESAESGGTTVLRRVISNGIQRALRSDDFSVFITRLSLREVESGVTEVTVLLGLATLKNSFGTLHNEFSQINHALSEAVDSGDMCRSLAAAAREETAWPDHLRKVIANELLEEAGDESILEEEEDRSIETAPDQMDTSMGERAEENEVGSTNTASSFDFNRPPHKSDGPFVPNNFDFDPEDLYLSGGNGGVFFDHSEQNIANAPFQGNLGPLLMDAATERARQRQPRVIAIGDVHGCIDELQALLRRCCFQPGDLVVFLGDLVSKGPDSLSVVQMAREIGSFGVRGNHDFEVIRWHQAIMSGADPPMIGSEHFHIASCLSKADLKWLYSLPWYLSSKDLGALFVHAGFVPGIRLPKQNPRLMMNMRSILPDGTVTSKFFSNWAWSRLWDGPQTVLFGHDADRGLQQYEHAIGLDTGCVYGGRLTACILPEKRLVSVSAKREYFQYRRKQFD